MTLGPVLAKPGVIGVIGIVIMFYMWFFLTCAILIAMEGCSAMVSRLHPLLLRYYVAGPADMSLPSCTPSVCSGSRPNPSTPSLRVTCLHRFLL